MHNVHSPFKLVFMYSWRVLYGCQLYTLCALCCAICLGAINICVCLPMKKIIHEEYLAILLHERQSCTIGPPLWFQIWRLYLCSDLIYLICIRYLWHVHSTLFSNLFQKKGIKFEARQCCDNILLGLNEAI